MGLSQRNPGRNDFPVSQELLEAFLEDSIALAKKYSISLDSVLKAKEVLELERMSSIRSLAGDYLDEFMENFGRDISRIADNHGPEA